MERIVLQVGGRSVAVEGDCALRFLHSYDGAQPFVVAEAEPDWHVRYGPDVAVPTQGEVLNSFVFREIDARCCFRRSGDMFYYDMRRSDGSMLVAMSHRFGSNRVDATSCDDASALRFSLWFALSMLGAPSSFTFVHSSVIVRRGRAVLFLGESGTGKSTHTRLWLKNIPDAHLLNDDSPILTIEDGRPCVYGSPWSGKTPCYEARRFPLAAVVRLSQAPQNAMRRLSIPAAFAALQPSLPPALMQDERYADLLIGIISDTISAVPSYHLACLPDDEAARLSCKTIFDNAL